MRWLCVGVFTMGCSFTPPGAQGSVDAPQVNADGAIDSPTAARKCLAAWRSGAPQLAEPTPLTTLNSSSQNDRDPSLTDDDRMLYFSSQVGGNGDVYFATRNDLSAPFGAPQLETGLSTGDEESRVTFTANGLFAIVASPRPGGSGANDLWVTSRTTLQAPFTTPNQLFVGDLNNSDHQLDPELASDGLTIYYADLINPQELRSSSRTSLTADFSPPPPEALFAMPSADPTISSDGLIIVFSSPVTTSEPGVALTNLWFAVRATTADSFGDPVLVPTVNSVGDEGDPELSADACELYFARRNIAGNYDLYSTTITPQ